MSLAGAARSERRARANSSRTARALLCSRRTSMLRPGGLILAHNINPRMAHPPFVEAITTEPYLETVVRGGMSISLKKK